MKNLTRAEAAEFLRAHDDYLILTHRKPDGDTAGSAALLCRALRVCGKRAHILRNPQLTPRFAALHEGLTAEQAHGGETVISVDVASAKLLPEGFPEAIALRIDHHASESFTALELVDTHAGACGELLYDLLPLLGVTLDRPMAVALYTAISTDTGCFCYANTTAHTFLAAAACAQTGADLFGVAQALFDTNSLPKLRLQAWITEHLRLYEGGSVAVCALPRAVELRLGAAEDDTENLSGFVRAIEGVKLAALLRENADGRVRLSVRAVPEWDAAAVCARFGGGGHRGAAGATLEAPLERAAEAVAEALREAVRR